MLKKNKNNYYIFLKNSLKSKNKIKKSIIHNYNIEIKKNIYFSVKENVIKKANLSQILFSRKNMKKKIYLNRWEIYNLYNSDQLNLFKR